jgi:hypothetical protein
LARFPRFIGTMECSDFSSPVPLHFVAFVPRYRPSTESTRSPRFLEDPCARAPLSDPGGPATFLQTIRAGRPTLPVAVVPSAIETASAPTTISFRGSITRPARSLSTLRSHGRPCTTQDSLPAGGPPWPVGIRTRGVPSRSFSRVLYMASSSPRLGLAHLNSRLVRVVNGAFDEYGIRATGPFRGGRLAGHSVWRHLQLARTRFARRELHRRRVG